MRPYFFYKGFMKIWHWIVVIVLGLMFVGSALYQSWERPKGGDVAPDVAITRLDGQQVHLSDYRGKVVLLHFWATWCGPCREEFPALEKFNQQMLGKPFVLLAVSEDGKSAKQDVERFSRHVKFSFPIYLDRAGAAADAYRVAGVPESILIDPMGNIVERFTGPQDWTSGDILNLIEQLFPQPEGK